MHFAIYVLFGLITAISDVVPVTHAAQIVGSEPTQPLFLTPYLESGRTRQAQRLSMVTSIDGLNHPSYSGYITVNKAYNSNLFFWFFPAKNNTKNAPVIMYLEGGPGDTSLRAVFLQGGPVTFNKKMKLINAKTTWTEKYSVIYVDNPVGTGFSFTNNDAGYATTQEDIARDLYSFVLQFFQIFHQYSANDLYFAGESYGGKYLPAIGYKIHQENQNVKQKINMKGFFVISGFSDPESVFRHYSPLLFNIGMLSEKERDLFQNLCDKAVSLIQEKKYLEAFQINGELFFGVAAETYLASHFFNFTGSYNTWNFLQAVYSPIIDKVHNYINKTEIRRALHVGNRPFILDNKVFESLLGDLMKSVKQWLPVLMDNYKVMYLNGQLDIIVNVPGTEALLMSVPWKGLNRYKNVDKVTWKIKPTDAEPAGYVRQVDNFYQVVVRNSGHAVPWDQPERCYDLLQRFIEGRSFSS